MRTGLAVCCASGHAAAALPRSVMNSRRLMAAVLEWGQDITTAFPRIAFVHHEKFFAEWQEWVIRDDIAMSALSSAIHNTRHYLVQPRPVLLVVFRHPIASRRSPCVLASVERPSSQADGLVPDFNPKTNQVLGA
jgi:hypothetical protein